MARYFSNISKNELKNKIMEAFGYPDQDDYINDSDKIDSSLLREKLEDDLKVDVDFENFDLQGGKLDLLGYHTLNNGLTFLGCTAGGDWQFPVFFLVYWDGKKLRAYVPTEGNPWNTDTKEAYGNNRSSDADLKNIKKRFASKASNVEDAIGDLDFDWKKIKEDILDRLKLADDNLPKTKNIAKVDKKPLKKKSIGERIESLEYYGTGDEAFELFQQTCGYCYQLVGLGMEEKAELICQWAEEMAESSKDWWVKEGGDLDDKSDVGKGVWQSGRWI